jgi:hypothetical protein
VSKRVGVGDVLEVTVPGGVAYLHYLGTHPDYGDGVAVSAGRFAEPVTVSEELFRNSYVTFYPARAAVVRGLARLAGRLPSPGLPTRMRRAGAMSGDRVVTWIIEDSSGEEVKRRLSQDELRLPLAEIWNHEFLVQRVVDGWRPENEG